MILFIYHKTFNNSGSAKDQICSRSCIEQPHYLLNLRIEGSGVLDAFQIATLKSDINQSICYLLQLSTQSMITDMGTRYKSVNSERGPTDTLGGKLGNLSVSKIKILEFKYLYFQIQKFLNKDVTLSFRPEQLRTPEIRLSLIKPLILNILKISSKRFLETTLRNALPGTETQYTSFGTFGAPTELTISTSVIYALLLLRYEYIIQSENNLIMFDLLITKANICEVLAIRLLREYRSHDRINLLFINPMRLHEDLEKLKNTKHLQCFNTLELSILSKSKKFLSQPAVVQILDRIYSGELMMNGQLETLSGSILDFLLASKLSTVRSGPSLHFDKVDVEDSSTYTRFVGEEGVKNQNVINYKFNRITIDRILMRSNTVPKYQSLVINIKYAVMTLLFLTLVLKHKGNMLENTTYHLSSFLSIIFWLVALSFNLDMAVKLLHIEFMFLKKIIWTYVDICIVILIDISFAMRTVYGLGKIDSTLYYNCFSLISILLIPRMLSIFNNYRFFNMIFVSLRKMLWNMVAMFCLFLSLTFGFFLCFISLTNNLNTYDVAFGMLKIFFGYTPAVWDNWKNYDNLGRSILLIYLFFIQFVVTTILAIVLSNIFVKVSETNNEEFEYLKTTNLIIYLKWSSSQKTSGRRLRLAKVFEVFVTIFKMPIILIIYFYEILIKDNKILLQKQQRDLKRFTFLSREDDLYGDRDMMLLNQGEEEDSLMRVVSKSGSTFAALRRPSCDAGNYRAPEHGNVPSRNLDAIRQNNNLKLIPQRSHATLPGFRSGLMDSAFIDGFLEKRYGLATYETNNSDYPRNRVHSLDSGKAHDKANTQILTKLQEMEDMLAQVIHSYCDSDQTAIQYLSFLGEYGENDDDDEDSFDEDDSLALDLV